MKHLKWQFIYKIKRISILLQYLTSIKCSVVCDPTTIPYASSLSALWLCLKYLNNY